MKKRTTALSLAVLFAGLNGTGAVYAAEAPATSDVQAQQLSQFNELKELFSAEKVSLEGVKVKYAATLQPAVIANNPDIDAKITAVLDAAIAGNMTVGQAKQAVDKGLQWFFYSEITNFTKVDVPELLKAGKVAEASAAFEKAIKLYEGSLQGTAGKRDTKFGTTTQDLLDTVVIPELRKQIQANDANSYNVTRQMLDKTLIKVFVLATLTYAEKLESEADPVNAKTQFSEGYFFFQPIFNSLKGGSQADAEHIEKAFASGDQSKVNFAKIKTAITRALNGKISGYYQKTLASMESGDLEKAQITAMEGNMFVAAQETLLKEEIGASAYANLESDAQKYFAAVKTGNVKEANLYGFKIVKALSNSDGVNLTLNEKALTVNGSEKQVDAASFVNKETNRTVVPTRFVAEGLGATVGYDDPTMTIKIEKDGTVIELQVDQDTVKKNGVVDAKLKLDQAVLLENGRSYIPLRAVAELFGNKVFYSNGEIVITK